MRVSSHQFSIKPLDSDNEFWDRVEIVTKSAKENNSDLLLFPEYFSLSWYTFGYTFGKSGDFRDILIKEKDKEIEFLERFHKLSNSQNIVIVAGTNPHLEGDTIFNRSWIFRPHKGPLFQDKVHMTRFEAEEWKISPGCLNDHTTFMVNEALCSVAICYDVEFPTYTAKAAKAGVGVILVPTCTDDVHGYWRVRHCSEARAIENQCYVVTSSLVGGNPNFQEISSHYGGGAVFTPCDVDFPEGGLLAVSKINREETLHEFLDLSKIHNIRKSGTVLNLQDSYL